MVCGVPLQTVVYSDKIFALGKRHLSWFLLSVDFPLLPACPVTCLNFIPPHLDTHIDASSYFVFHGAPRSLSLVDLLRLRDDKGHAILKMTGEQVCSKPVIEVLMDARGVLRCCTRCGIWEALHGDRFRACDDCGARFYCSEVVSARHVGLHYERLTSLTRLGLVSQER